MVYARLCAVVSAAAILSISAAASAQPQGTEKGAFGLGLIIGEPTGVSAKLYLDDNTAIDAAIGSAVVGGGIQAHADFLWHPWILTGAGDPESKFVLPAYVGIGARVLDHDRGRGADDDFHIGIRVVGGIVFDFKTIPLDVFVEIAAVGDIRFGSGDSDHDGFGPDLNAGAGARYYF